MLLKVEPAEDGTGTTLRNMHVPHFPEMTLFHTAIEAPKDEEDNGKIIVTYTPPQPQSDKDTKARESRRLEIPLRLRTEKIKKLKTLNVTMHRSPTTGYNMGAEYNDWFSACFGFPVVLVYLGANTREVLGTLAPGTRSQGKWWTMWRDELIGGTQGRERWLIYLAFVYFVGGIVYKAYKLIQDGQTPTGTIAVAVLSFAAPLATMHWYLSRRRGGRIAFADCAPFLVISETSVDDVSARLPEGEEMDLTKFRPNIVVSGTEKAFEEDFWSELGIGPCQTRLFLTGNCLRCKSLNVDFQTGQMGAGESGSVLKKLMEDRRVDRGARFKPVFGRYSFLDRAADGQSIRVGDEVEVLARGRERTVTGESNSLSWMSLFADKTIRLARSYQLKVYIVAGLCVEHPERLCIVCPL